ncbi:Barwin domain-containing protein [Dioscorea alata]|uniref:Barwin domain-containing protein n=1 Tax=Dioscorea alata TaxID=55571 RepID=A0ACB7VDN9_DIOAL|nr:Barwin domain-containing protein [Dioscorea alata]
MASHIPAIEVEPPGCSFKPSFEAHKIAFTSLVYPALILAYIVKLPTCQNIKKSIQHIRLAFTSQLQRVSDWSVLLMQVTVRIVDQCANEGLDL